MSDKGLHHSRRGLRGHKYGVSRSRVRSQDYAIANHQDEKHRIANHSLPYALHQNFGVAIVTSQPYVSHDVSR